MNIAFLGPAGTFTHQAALLLQPGASLEACHSVTDVCAAVADGIYDAGVVPFENSTEGAVNETLDALIDKPGLIITAQLTLKVCQCLMLREDTAVSGITRILSHPQSLAQCRAYLRAHFPQTPVEPVESNAEAARRVCESSGACLAAIGPADAAARYGLCVHAENIQDHANNLTSFIQIASAAPPRLKRGHRASVVFSTYNKPGELYRMLSIFDVYRVNMTRIISRPRKAAPGEYVFFIDIEDFIPRDASRALTLIKERTPFYRELGVYKARAVKQRR